MRYDDDFDRQEGFSGVILLTIVGVSIFILLLLIGVLAYNKVSLGKKVTDVIRDKDKAQSEAEKDRNSAESGRTASDLNFWNAYPVRQSPGETSEAAAEDTADAGAAEITGEEEDDPALDGKHTLLKYPDGTEEWVLISPYLRKNDYDFTKLVSQSGIMKYYEDGRQTSFVGVDLSKYNGKVDFKALKNSGVDFCMLRAGVRGYESGTILPDDSFQEYLQGASEAGLQIGVYFTSQAVNTDEVLDEAAFIVQNLGEYKITYPISISMSGSDSRDSRTAELTRDQRTEILNVFCDAIAGVGYVPMIQGDKYFLMEEIDISRLSGAYFWYNENSDIPDYPYSFGIWQYNTAGRVSGAAGEVNLDISFVNFGER